MRVNTLQEKAELLISWCDANSSAKFRYLNLLSVAKYLKYWWNGEKVLLYLRLCLYIDLSAPAMAFDVNAVLALTWTPSWVSWLSVSWKSSRCSAFTWKPKLKWRNMQSAGEPMISLCYVCLCLLAVASLCVCLPWRTRETQKPFRGSASSCSKVSTASRFHCLIFSHVIFFFCPFFSVSPGVSVAFTPPITTTSRPNNSCLLSLRPELQAHHRLMITAGSVFCWEPLRLLPLTWTKPWMFIIQITEKSFCRFTGIWHAFIDRNESAVI